MRVRYSLGVDDMFKELGKGYRFDIKSDALSFMNKEFNKYIVKIPFDDSDDDINDDMEYEDYEDYYYINNMIVPPKIKKTIESVKNTVSRHVNLKLNGACKPWFTDDMLLKVDEDKNKFIVGHKYSIQNSAFSLDYVFELKNVVEDENLGDILVMKQIGGSEMALYTITPQDCTYLNIPFESGLIIFTKDSNNFIDIDNVEKEYNENDLSTYPKDYNDLTIHEIVVVCDKFFAKGKDRYMFADGTEFYMSENPKITLRLKDTIPSIDGSLPIFKNSRYLTKPQFFTSRNKTFMNFTIRFSDSNHIGISTKALEGKKLDDLFDINLEITP